MQIEESCSWCHELNEMRFRYCACCGHEAHVARMDCCCRQCAEPFRRVSPDTKLRRELERERIRSRMRDV